MHHPPFKARASAPPSTVDNMSDGEMLLARVVVPGPQPAIHGYSLYDDLAVHYGLAEVTFLTLTGELPSPTQRDIFGLACVVTSAASVQQPPAHVAVLARTCGARAAGVFAAGATTLAEQAAAQVEEHSALLAWLEAGAMVSPPSEYVDNRSMAFMTRLRAQCINKGCSVAALEYSLTPLAAALCMLHSVGLQQSWQLQAALCLARWPAVMAEGMATPRLGFKDYPMTKPQFTYVETL